MTPGVCYGPMRAIAYVRLSSYRGADDPSTSPERQREQCAAYCVAKGWELVDTVEDLDVSGSAKGLRLDRPGINRVRAALPTVDVVVFAKLDRLARNVMDFATFAEEAHGHGVALVSVAESLDLTTPSGRFVATILAAFAEMEAATISLRTREGKAAASALGRWTGGQAGYGTRPVPNPGGPGVVLAEHPEEAAALRRMVAWLGEGWSFARIARQLNADGVPTRRGGPWTASTARSVVTGTAAAEHVLSPAERRTVRLRPTKEVRPRGRRPARLLSGVLQCHACLTPLQVGQSREVPLYRCITTRNGGNCPRSVTIVAAAAEEYVTAEWLAEFGDLPETRVVRAADATDERLANLDEDIEAAAAELPRASRTRRMSLLADLEALEDERERLLSAPRSSLSVVQETGRTLGEAWAAATVEGRREMVLRHFGPVRVGPGRPGAASRVSDRLVWGAN